MKPHWLFLPVLSAAALLLTGPLRAAPVAVGSVPAGVREPERGTMSRAALMLSRGEFRAAAALLEPLAVPPVCRVHVDWTPVPPPRRPAYQLAVRQVVAGWNAALAGRVRFQTVPAADGADVLLLFEQYVAVLEGAQLRGLCSDVAVDTSPRPGQPRRRTARLRVGLFVPGTDVPHSAFSVAHLAGQGLGAYLGLAASAEELSLMGPDPHGETPPKPSPAEARQARELLGLREQLLRCARSRVRVSVPAPIAAVDPAEVDLGKVPPGESRKGYFTVRNSGTRSLLINLRSDCGCLTATADPVVPPGGEVRIEVELRTEKLRGEVANAVVLTTNDPERPRISVPVRANVTLPSRQSGED
jgi:hypothetical protein